MLEKHSLGVEATTVEQEGLNGLLNSHAPGAVRVKDQAQAVEMSIVLCGLGGGTPGPCLGHGMFSSPMVVGRSWCSSDPQRWCEGH